WSKGQKIKKIDKNYYFIVTLAMVVAFSLVFLGFYLFDEIEGNITFISIIAISFGLSLGATVSNIFKYQETWLNWTIYNTFQLIKNAMQLNLPNVVKYVFYLFNGTITWIDWKFNGDVESIKNIA
ncbi:MAG TPA: nicotinamide mononucleotide transporter, partial [Saprospiraceae bacterium]|nr:nicotinamide mononucleotide transporter [Saprospiraceae bacterium]